MEERFNCKICERDFKSKEALDMHNSAKHEDKSQKRKFPIKKKHFIWFIVLAFIFLGFYFLFSYSAGQSGFCDTGPVNEINIGGHTALALHIHPNLRIIINDVEEIIPGDIGILQNAMRPIHTHESGGVLHLESKCYREFKLKEFFEIWERNFNSTCIFENCGGELRVSVNGQEILDFENYLMRDHDNIVIEYRSV
jgi:hypothetical protein